MRILIQHYQSLSVFCKETLHECDFYRKTYPVIAPYFEIPSFLKNNILCLFLKIKKYLLINIKNLQTGKKSVCYERCVRN